MHQRMKTRKAYGGAGKESLAEANSGRHGGSGGTNTMTGTHQTAGGSERLLGISREAGALWARVARQMIAPDFGSPASVAEAAEAGAWYRIALCSLDALPLPLFPQKMPLLAAWDALGHAEAADAQVRDALRLTLTETVLGESSSQALPPFLPEPDRARRDIKPTAAHPRAYRGTKHKPPKPKEAAPSDLHPALCGAGRLSLLSEAEEAGRAAEARLPALFRTTLYPLIRSGNDAETRAALALYWALGLEDNPARLAAAAYLLSLRRGPHAHAWCQLAAALPPHQQTPMLHLLIASGADAVAMQDLPPHFSEMLAETLSGTDPLYRAHWLLHGLTTGIAPDYLLAGYEIADAYGQSYSFHAVRQSGAFPLQTVLAWGAHCREASEFYSGALLHLWEQCGLRAGLGEHLERTNWAQHPPAVAWRCVILYASSWANWGDLADKEADAKWQAARPLLGAWETLLHSIPVPYQEKCVRHLVEYLWQWDTPRQLADNLPAAWTLTRRLCHPPFAPKSDPTETTARLLANLPLAARTRFLDAPDASLRRLEDACRRENSARLTGRGISTLAGTLPHFAVRCFEAYPSLLLKVAKLLGCLPEPMRDAVVGPFRASPLCRQDLAALPLPDVADIIAAQCGPHVFHPMPRALREHLVGTRTLTPAALARAAAQTGTQALRTGLEMLEQAALQTLGEGYEVEKNAEPVRHAMQMERLAEENRRALRKFLRAYWSGQTDYLETHPETRRWVAAHPQLNLDVWRQGVSFQRELKNFGTVSVAAERNPLEALRLGTYVGSCLGLGGHLTYSAAAVVLDINKQVVYARDARGNVLARQIIALTEDTRVVCFSVYPLGAAQQVTLLFAHYDRLLSEALGLPLCQPDSEEDYEIAAVLSHAWWDDGAWDLRPDTDPGRP